MLAALAFIVKKLIGLDINFSLFTNLKTLAIIAGLSVVQLISLFLVAFIWWLILKFFTPFSPDILKTIGIYFKSNIAKYLPGNLGQFLGRQIFGVSLGMMQAQLALSSVFEIGFTILSALIIALAFGGSKIVEAYRALFPNGSLFLIGIIICVLIVAIILLLIFKKYRIITEILKLLKEKVFWIRSIAILLLYIVQFLLFGIIFALLVRLSVQTSIADVFIFLAASVISWLAGFIIPGVPGGIGIRESVLLLTLPMFPQDVILSAAIIQRIIMIVGDVLAWLVGIILSRQTASPDSSN